MVWGRKHLPSKHRTRHWCFRICECKDSKKLVNAIKIALQTERLLVATSPEKKDSL